MPDFPPAVLYEFCIGLFSIVSEKMISFGIKRTEKIKGTLSFRCWPERNLAIYCSKVPGLHRTFLENGAAALSGAMKLGEFCKSNYFPPESV
jgi:hypothetical protein